MAAHPDRRNPYRRCDLEACGKMKATPKIMKQFFVSILLLGASVASAQMTKEQLAVHMRGFVLPGQKVFANPDDPFVTALYAEDHMKPWQSAFQAVPEGATFELRIRPVPTDVMERARLLLSLSADGLQTCVRQNLQTDACVVARASGEDRIVELRRLDDNEAVAACSFRSSNALACVLRLAGHFGKPDPNRRRKLNSCTSWEVGNNVPCGLGGGYIWDPYFGIIR